MEFDEYEKQIEVLELERAKAMSIAKKAIEDTFAARLKPYTAGRIEKLNTQNIEKGDIIELDGVIIKVDVISYGHARTEANCYLEFQGTPLTKRLLPKKDKYATDFIQKRYGKMPTIIKKKQS